MEKYRLREAPSRWWNDGEQKKAMEQRRQVHRLYFEGGYSKTAIAKQLGVSKALVVRWTQAVEQDLAQDARGWPKGRGRRWDERVYARVQQLHAALTNDPREFFVGATAIHQRYRRRYPRSPVPPLRTIGRMLAELGLSTSPKRGRGKGAARYLCYPEHTVLPHPRGAGLGGRLRRREISHGADGARAFRRIQFQAPTQTPVLSTGYRRDHGGPHPGL